ncbi:Cysteine-rich CPCC [Chitinophaga eiseniae]|uniref:Cysteine-rich CPCC n=1 Tax=Chitinophaga eiseniae TaxID=634771 RepID=A0A1T4L3G2_9BACT|nr:CPCC family cysteine-rich protein [Chitinophaga eiseniae]SJZ49060.1 Cysteine-rich CPCC [Chitinophaga eiseniae]
MLASRDEAVAFASFLKITLLSEEERQKELYNAKCEHEIADETVMIDEVQLLQQYIQAKFVRYTNTYIETFFHAKFGLHIKITGAGPVLHACRCCNYKTLAEVCAYDICPVCFWEDDGTSETYKYSSPNRMTLSEARANFKRYGVVEERFVAIVDPERMMQYSPGTGDDQPGIFPTFAP